MKRKKPKLEGKRTKDGRRFHVSYGHALLVLSGMLLMALIEIVFIKPRSDGTKALASGRGTVSATERRKSDAAWGELEYTPLALDRPAEYFTNDVPQEKTVWTIRAPAFEVVNQFFTSLQLDDDGKAFVTNAVNWEKVNGGFRLSPPPEVVMSLGADTREKLYAHLAQFPENLPQRMPFQFRGNGFNQWFDECGLVAAKLEMVKKLTYRRKDVICFSDAAAFSQISTPAETMCLVKALWRVSTFIMSVRVAPGSDVEQLVSYWGRGGRAQQYRPMLEALSRNDAGIAVPISYFLPGFARMRLYTYPRPSEPRSIREDCFWSSMNFFNELPDDRFFNPAETKRALQQDYLRVAEGQKLFGDTIMLVNGEGKALHMAIYIADDVVFTKNGFDMAQPWVLMRINEMLASYEQEKPYEMMVYRRKTLPGGRAPTLSSNRFTQALLQ